MSSPETTPMKSRNGENCGVILTNRGGDDPLSLNRDEIISLFKKHGALVFRGFGFDGMEKMVLFTERFGKKFATHPSIYRGKVNEDDTVQTVDFGSDAIPLHSEMAFLPAALRPEMAFFYCVKTTGDGGHTLLCDGTKVPPLLSAELRQWLESNRLKYKLVYPAAIWQRFFRTTSRDELNALLKRYKADDCLTLKEDNAIYLERVADGLTKPKFSRKKAFANMMVFYYVRAVPLVTLENGEPIPKSINEELLGITDDLSAEVDWHVDDLLMFDNTRMMHGRRAFGDDERVIYTRFCATAF